MLDDPEQSVIFSIAREEVGLMNRLADRASTIEHSLAMQEERLSQLKSEVRYLV